MNHRTKHASGDVAGEDADSRRDQEPAAAPLIAIRMDDQRRTFHPGDRLAAEVQVAGVAADDVVALECSVMWYTEGKGDEDFGVHLFQRYTPHEHPDRDLRGPHRLDTVLPNSPHSYVGVIVKIRWCLRVRVFLKSGRPAVREQPIELLARPS